MLNSERMDSLLVPHPTPVLMLEPQLLLVENITQSKLVSLLELVMLELMLVSTNPNLANISKFQEEVISDSELELASMLKLESRTHSTKTNPTRFSSSF